MRNFILKKLPAFFFILVFSLFAFVYTQTDSPWELLQRKIAQASASDSVTGWSWTDTVGWFSYNSTSDGSPQDYGVNLVLNPTDSGFGDLEGYAWSDGMGWLKYNPNTTDDGAFPQAPNYASRVDLCTGEVTGWAKLLNMGEDGWLLHSYDDGVLSYNTNVDLGTGAFTGYAWNNTIGWMQYDPPFGGVFTTVDSIQQAPVTPTLIKPIEGKETWLDYPEFRSSPLQPVLTWSSFDDPNCADTQQAYKVQISESPHNPDGTFNVVIYEKQYNSSANAHAIELPTPLIYSNPRKTYWWNVQVQDSNGQWSPIAWEDGYFQTPLHPPPVADFDNEPIDIHADVEIQFNDKSESFGGSTIVTWEWNFYFDNNGVWELLPPSPVSEQNPKFTFPENGTYRVDLTVWDSSGYSDTETKIYNIEKELPIFDRTLPR